LKQNVERKSSWCDDHLDCICGFVNGRGGVLEIGRNNRVFLDTCLAGVDLAGEAWRVPRSSVYALRPRRGGSPESSDRRQSGKRGSKTALSDEELLREIRTVLRANPFLGEGHQKVKARLAAKGIRVVRNRVLRLMHALRSFPPRPSARHSLW